MDSGGGFVQEDIPQVPAQNSKAFNNRERSEESEIIHLDKLLLTVTRRFRNRTHPSGYNDLPALWVDLSPIILHTVGLHNGFQATQYLLRITGDFHDYMTAWPGTDEEDLEEYFMQLDDAWVEVLRRPDSGVTITDKIRLGNLLRDGRERAERLNVKVASNGIREIYERSLDIIESGKGDLEL